jgi:ABC-type polysaccharide transport system permease subunit
LEEILLKGITVSFRESLDIFAFLGFLSSPLPVILAIFLNEVRNQPFKRIFQTVSTLPNYISWVIVFSLSFSMFSSDGVINSLLSLLHISDTPLNVMGNLDFTWYFQTLLGIWKGTGWGAIIYLAAISGIDDELYDAAKVDGAGRFRSIIHITVPGITPTFLVLLLLSVSNILSVGFDQFLVFYNGLVADKITVLDVYVYRLGLVTNDYPYSTAVGILKTLISIILLFTVNNISKRIRGESLV